MKPIGCPTTPRIPLDEEGVRLKAKILSGIDAAVIPDGLTDEELTAEHCFTKEEAQQIKDAIRLGIAIHADQKPRVDGLYTNHILRVMEFGFYTLGIRHPAILTALPLHDTVEDQASLLAKRLDRLPSGPFAGSDREKALAYLTHAFGREVACIVGGVSQMELPPDMARERRNEIRAAAFEKAMRVSRIFLVKLPDTSDNGFKTQNIPDPELQLRLATKDLPRYPILIKALLRDEVLFSMQMKIFLIELLMEAEANARKIVESANQ